MYKTIAPYYDLIHQELKEDIEYVVKLAAQCGDPVLELGCGTGRLLLPLARTGHLTTGVDSSPEMLKIARNKIADERKAVKERISLVEADMESFRLDEKFHLILIPHNTLMHLTSARVNSCLRNIRKMLHDDGRLFIDVENPFIVADSAEDDLLILERTMLDPATGDTVLQMTSSWVNTERQTREIVWIFDSNPRDGGRVSRHVAKDTFHYLFAHELEVILGAAGFRMDSISGDYDGTKYGEDCPRLLLLVSAK